MADLIIVDVTDNEKSLLDGNLNLKEINGNGRIMLKNPSENSRLWNLNCDLKEIVNTTITTRELDVGILNPGQEYTTEYEVHNLKEPSLKVIEVFDTERNLPDKVNNVFLFNNDNQCKLQLVLSNPLNQDLSNIKLRREIPDFFQNIELLTPTNGVAGVIVEEGSKSLTWDLITLGAQQSATLDLFCSVSIKDKSVKSLGNLSVTYLINNYKLTMINPEVRGLTDSLSGIDRDEGSTPGLWECEVEFVNESGFQVRLENVKVSHKIITGTENVVSQSPNRLLNPNESWNFDFQVESKDVPELSSSIEFTPLYVVITRVIGEINKDSTIYPILSATIDKTINPPEIDAYANTDMTIENVMINNGSSLIEHFRFTDEIPNDFIPPLLNEIKISLAEMDISSRQEFTKMLVIEPEDQNPEITHLIKIELFNLSSQLTSNSKLVLSYPIKARNPRPPTEIIYKTPVKIEVNTLVKGKYFSTVPLEEPEIKVKYVKRKLKTLKSIKPGLSEGEFSVSIRIQNKGNVELENILVKDIIPTGFDLSNINIENYTLEKSVDNSILIVKIVELKGNESLNLEYRCSGQGDYPRHEPEVNVQGRSGSDSSPTEPKTPEPHYEGSSTEINLEQQGTINDVFLSIFKKLDQTITSKELGDFIESMRDEFPPGPLLHQFMKFAKEIKTDSPDKLIVGSSRDEIVTKLTEFKNQYL